MRGLALEAFRLCFVTVFTSTIRGVLGDIAGSIALLLALALIEGLSSASSWRPTRLAASGADLIQHPGDNVWNAALISVATTLAALTRAFNRLGKSQL